MRAPLVMVAAAAFFLAALVAAWAFHSAHQITGQASADHTIYCSWHGGLPVGFLVGPGLGSGCPPGFRKAG